MNKLLALLILTFTIGVFSTQVITAQTKEEKEAAKKAKKEQQQRGKEEARAAKTKLEFERKNPINVTRIYDKFENGTVVKFDLLDVPTRKDLPTLSFSARYSYYGNEVREPEFVQLAFASSGFSKNDSLILIVDGERIDLGNPIFLANTNILVAYNTNLETLRKIAKAKFVEGRIGSFAGEFVLTQRHLDAIKALLNYETLPQ